ncbi:MAG TPA: helicase-associated domain-containing protein [Corynebacteriales bacterium]|nr:helicase-associated domain-containing protein [Mycobacteriales bacterium]
MDTNSEITWDEWLSNRSTEELSDLLQLRPDVVVPPPTSFVVLSTRLTQQRSYRRALSNIRRPLLHALYTLAENKTAQRNDVDPDILDPLTRYALIFNPTPESIALAPGLAEVLPHLPIDYTASTLRAAASLRDTIATLPEPQKKILYTLKDAGRRGKTTALKEKRKNHPIAQLVAEDLLHVEVRDTAKASEKDTVILPEDVYDALHNSEAAAHSAPLELPLPADKPSAGASLMDRITTNAGAEAAALVLHQAQLLIDAIDRQPLQELADGGIGQRELSRLANETGLAQPNLIFALEAVAALGIIEEGLLNDGEWTTTSVTEQFLNLDAPRQWQPLLEAWWESPRPWSGTPEERALSLHPQASDSQHVAVRHSLAELLTLWPDTVRNADTTDIAALAKWRFPLKTFLRGGSYFHDFIYSAAALGVIHNGVITPVGKALLADDTDKLAEQVTEVYPKPVDTLYIQDDYTALAPGPLSGDNADHMRRIAIVESPGLATVYRFTQESIRHGLDTGLTASEILEFLTGLAATPVPQSLSYFIEDCARKHGALRVGPALSVLHAEDPTLVRSVMALPLAEECGMRMLAPTVAIAQVYPRELLTALQNAGMSPSAENTQGEVVSLIRHRPRATLSNGYTVVAGETANSGFKRLSEERAMEMASRICANEETNRMAGETYSGDELIKFLDQAIDRKQEVIVGFVKGSGVEAQARVLPTGMSAGRLDAFDNRTQRAYRFALHKLRFVRSINKDNENHD